MKTRLSMRMVLKSKFEDFVGLLCHSLRESRPHGSTYLYVFTFCKRCIISLPRPHANHCELKQLAIPATITLHRKQPTFTPTIKENYLLDRKEEMRRLVAASDEILERSQNNSK